MLRLAFVLVRLNDPEGRPAAVRAEIGRNRYQGLMDDRALSDHPFAWSRQADGE